MEKDKQVVSLKEVKGVYNIHSESPVTREILKTKRTQK